MLCMKNQREEFEGSKHSELLNTQEGEYELPLFDHPALYPCDELSQDVLQIYPIIIYQKKDIACLKYKISTHKLEITAKSVSIMVSFTVL